MEKEAPTPAGPALPPLRVAPQRMASELAGHLEQLIAAGQVAAGSRLPSERTLAVDFGVSRATVRQALAELESKRLIERRQGRGSTVLERPEEVRELTSALAGHAPQVRDALELRRIVEPRLARIATHQALPSDLVLMRRVMDRTSEHLSPAESMRLDIEFHLLLARATQNPLLPTVLEFSYECTESVRLVSHDTLAKRRTSLEGHRRILEAVAARDADAAEAAMESHLADIEEISS